MVVHLLAGTSLQGRQTTPIVWMPELLGDQET
jgi:hypothetical protein